MKKKIMAMVLSIFMTAGLAACGSASSTSTAASAAASTAASTAASAGSTASSGLKVALCLSGAANDQGWNQSAYEGTKKACEKYGCTLEYTENLAAADIAAAFTDYATAGYNVIIGHGFEFGDPALEVAANFPDVKFICTEADASSDNVASYVMACEQTAYIEGIIAAKTTSSIIKRSAPFSGSREPRSSLPSVFAPLTVAIFSIS